MSDIFLKQLDAIKKANLSADRNMEMQMLVIVLRLMREMKAQTLEIVIQKRAWENGFDMPGLMAMHDPNDPNDGDAREVKR